MGNDREGPPGTGRQANALAQIEAALQLAFSGESGTRRLARLRRMLGDRDPIADLKDPRAQAAYIAAAVTELERLRERARSNGVILEPWEEAIARLDPESPDILDTALGLAAHIGANPALAVRAQARLKRNIVHSLTG